MIKTTYTCDACGIEVKAGEYRWIQVDKDIPFKWSMFQICNKCLGVDKHQKVDSPNSVLSVLKKIFGVNNA